MHTAVFVDDAGHACDRLACLSGVQLVVVACPPRLPWRVARWVAPAARERWRQHWLHELRQRLAPSLAQAGGAVEWVVARGALPAVVAALRRRHGSALPLLDLRRPRFGAELAPLAGGGGARAARRWAMPAAVTAGMSMLLALSD